LLPLILPGIITGLSLLLLAVRISLKLSLITIFLGHGTALISVAATEIFAGLQKMDRRQEEASLDLGATPWRTFWLVTLPNLKLSLIAAALLIFTLSWTKSPCPFFSTA
jgi:spermidine/putrescine transport system permease protein